MKKIVCLTALLLAFGVAHANEATDAPEKFIALMTTGKTDQALDSVMTPDADGTKREVSKEVKASAKVLVDAAGPYKYHERLQTQELGTRWKKLIYIVGFEKRPMLVVFETYKPEDTWFIRTYTYTTDFDINNGNITYK